MGLDWMKSTGYPNIENQITNGSHVIILMGNIAIMEAVYQYHMFQYKMV